MLNHGLSIHHTFSKYIKLNQIIEACDSMTTITTSQHTVTMGGSDPPAKKDSIIIDFNEEEEKLADQLSDVVTK